MPKIASFRKPVYLSIALHIVLLVVLLSNLTYTTSLTFSNHDKQKPIQAIAVSSQSVQAATRAIQQREHQKQVQAAAKLKRLHARAVAMKRARQAEQKRLQRLKAQQKRLQQQEKARARAIALKKQRERRRVAALKAKVKRQKRLAALAHKQQALQQKLLQQQMQNEQKVLSSVQNKAMSNVISRYKSEIIHAIGQNWVVPTDANRKLSCQFLIHVAPGGVVLEVKLLRSSGNAALDRSAEAAIYKASPLPVPKSASLFDKFRELRLTVSPKVLVSG